MAFDSRRILAAGVCWAGMLAISCLPAAAWPSLSQQLGSDQVRPGSALERLIRDNQDFTLLRAGEAGDRLGLPPWLRVAWRRHHPEGRYSPADRAGGYPLVLQEVHEWMVAHQDLRPVAAPPRAARSLDANRKSVTEANEQRVSGAQEGPRYESMIRLDYRDPTRIVGGSNTGDGPQQMFYSTDGGASWGQTRLPLVADDAIDSDPAVDWTSDGTAWTTTIGISLPKFVLRLRAYRSTDAGATWTFDATLSGDGTAADKDMLWADHSATSPFQGNLYVIWHDGPTVLVNRHTPAGGWSPSPLRISGAETTGEGIGGDIRTNSAGEVFAFWPDTGSQQLFVAKSIDGGASFGKPVPVASTFASFWFGVPSHDSRKVLIYATGGADKTAAASNVYVSWVDLSGEVSCTTGSEAPGPATASSCKSRIWFSRSTDGGATWSAPVKINDQPASNDQFAPWLVVDEIGGKLAITYDDTVDDPNRLATHLYYQSSVDDGVHWSAPERVTRAPTDETAPGAKLQSQYGDYNGLTGLAGKFFPSWTDRRGGGHEEIWSAAITDSAHSACGASESSLCLLDNRFQVTVTWTSPGGQSGSGHAVPLTSDTGYFWFFGPTNVEVVLKVLDACSLSRTFWVFAGGLTDVQAQIVVVDRLTGASKTYTNPQSTRFQPIQDTGAFATCAAAP